MKGISDYKKDIVQEFESSIGSISVNCSLKAGFEVFGVVDVQGTNFDIIKRCFNETNDMLPQYKEAIMQDSNCYNFSLRQFTTKPLVQITWDDVVQKYENPYIMMHYTVSSFDRAKSLFLGQSPVSAHYMIKENGEVYYLVDDQFKAWHGGLGDLTEKSKLHSAENIKITNNINGFSIAIEIANSGNQPFTKEQVDSGTNLVVYLSERYNVDPFHIIGHNVWSPDRKMDPGPYWEEMRNSLVRVYDKDKDQKCFFPYSEGLYHKENVEAKSKTEYLDLKNQELLNDVAENLKSFGISFKEERDEAENYKLNYSLCKAMVAFKTFYSSSMLDQNFMASYHEWYNNNILQSINNNTSYEGPKFSGTIEEQTTLGMAGCFSEFDLSLLSEYLN